MSTFIRRKDNRLFVISLRVLIRLGQGDEPSRRDMIILRRHAGPAGAGLPVDHLCCNLLRRELETGDRRALPLAG